MGDGFIFCIGVFCTVVIFLFCGIIYTANVEIDPAQYEFVNIMQTNQPSMKEDIKNYMESQGGIEFDEYVELKSKYNELNNSDFLGKDNE